jgi:hypothetical protein
LLPAHIGHRVLPIEKISLHVAATSLLDLGDGKTFGSGTLDRNSTETVAWSRKLALSLCKPGERMISCTRSSSQSAMPTMFFSFLTKVPGGRWEGQGARHSSQMPQPSSSIMERGRWRQQQAQMAISHSVIGSGGKISTSASKNPSLAKSSISMLPSRGLGIEIGWDWRRTRPHQIRSKNFSVRP